ncbi:MAG TPA: prephenate dehydrogenase/arogenate dehydrogenase family protein [Gemmatimonadales bacterium]|nr:prephenate dehydrogenase/arogenate dehydrogenase family protein [Gemmatimonadales bacterium]
MTDELSTLRERIAAVDAELVALVARRLALARDVGEAKRAAGLPVRSFGTEAEVLARFRDAGAALGLDPSLAERLAHVLIGASVRRQEESLAAPSEPGRRILVVGGAGRMGRWLDAFFLGQGHRVTTLDPGGDVPGCARATDLAAAVAGADVVIVATPLSVGARSLGGILAAAPRALVADIFSLKSHVIEELRGAAARGLRVASLHPMFGPDVQTLGGRVLAVLDCGNAAAADEAAALFADTALTITRLPVEAHDAYMQYVLGLSHLVAMLFFTTLAASRRPFDELARVAGTTFYKQARTAAELARENPQLYYEIQKLNRHSRRLFALVKQSLAEIERAALDERPDAFLRLMEAGRAYFPDSLPAELE